MVADNACGAVRAEGVQVGEVRLTSEPKFEGCDVWWQWGMWDPLFYVGGCQDSEWPKEIVEVGIKQHRPCHATNSVVGMFSHAILWWQIWDSFLVCDAICLAVGFHLPLDKLWCIVDT